MKPLAIATVILLIVLSIPLVFTLFNPPKLVTLTQSDVEKIASNYIAATYPGSTITKLYVTEKVENTYKITIEYNQNTGNACKKYKCYYEGPASQFCRQDSPNGLGPC